VPKQSSHDKENAWIQAVAADWVNPDLTATSYDKSGQVLGYRRPGAPITAEEIVWFDSLAIARSASSGATISAVNIIHADHLNSPRALSNARLQSGQAADVTVWRWDLVASNAGGSNAFGSFAANGDPDLNGSSVKFDLRFPGQQNDAETGLSYNYFRDYEAGTGRYVESDPIGLEEGDSTYQYVNSDPTSLVDPSGLRAGFGPVPSMPRPQNLDPPNTYYSALCCKNVNCDIQKKYDEYCVEWYFCPNKYCRVGDEYLCRNPIPCYAVDSSVTGDKFSLPFYCSCLKTSIQVLPRSPSPPRIPRAICERLRGGSRMLCLASNYL